MIMAAAIMPPISNQLTAGAGAGVGAGGAGVGAGAGVGGAGVGAGAGGVGGAFTANVPERPSIFTV